MPKKGNQAGKGKPVPNSEGTRWKKGRSGNPGGRPRTAVLSEAYQEELASPAPGDREGRTNTQAIARAVVKKARAGDLRAAQELADRIEGRPRQSVEHAGEGGGPMKIVYISRIDAPERGPDGSGT
jgi:hypothetical protein